MQKSACRLFTDGGARGNPGPAAGAGVILDADGTVLAEVSEYLGVATNNVAEYRALALTLRKAHELGCQAVVIHMDSELIVRQLNGLYKVKDPKMRELYGDVRALLRKFSDWQVRHVPRTQNQEADGLVNSVLDAHIAERGEGV
ncbi:MAG: ribonuclease HI family protein [Candidatus Eremiobacteraeota bacterium]|nr:ribonuclease HI family protein [Candidatus Eremiobacteraeota bacterium]MBV8263283.1 ribonuclease HI family protein [Candidatus Eremiobacteraeota bacterium]